MTVFHLSPLQAFFTLGKDIMARLNRKMVSLHCVHKKRNGLLQMLLPHMVRRLVAKMSIEKEGPR